MDNNLHRRSVGRTPSHSEGIGNPYRRRSPSQSRISASQPINFKALKNTGIHAAKSLTNKIITLSNTGVQAATVAINNYRENSTGNSSRSAQNVPSDFERIQKRLTTTEDPIVSHRELVAAIEYSLTWSWPPAQVPSERDRFGAITKEALDKFRLLNPKIMAKILIYVEGRKDCCLFIVKFVTWKMRTTKCPEEVLLSLEMVASCVETLGGYFLALFSKSLMRTFRKLLHMTSFKHSLAHGVKKQLTKLLVGSSGAHPGVATDGRIHVIKSKILYMIQTWHDVFLLEQAIFPAFYEGYRNLRARGVRFPIVAEADKQKINKNLSACNVLAATSSDARSTSSSLLNTSSLLGAGDNNSFSSGELDGIWNAVQVLNDADPGSSQYEAALVRLKRAKQRLVQCIETLVEDDGRHSETKQMLLERMLRLNSAIDSHVSLTGGAGSESSANILQQLQTSTRGGGPTCAGGSVYDDNLLDLASESDCDFDENKPVFGISSGSHGDSFDDYFSSADQSVGDTSAVGGLQESSKPARRNLERIDDFFADVGGLDFGNVKVESTLKTNSLSRQVDEHYISNVQNVSMSSREPSTVLPTNVRGLKHDANGDNSTIQEKKGKDSNPEAGEGTGNDAPAGTPLDPTSGEKSLEQIMDELDNIDFDFGHMSVTGF